MQHVLIGVIGSKEEWMAADAALLYRTTAMKGWKQVWLSCFDLVRYVHKRHELVHAWNGSNDVVFGKGQQPFYQLYKETRLLKNLREIIWQEIDTAAMLGHKVTISFHCHGYVGADCENNELRCQHERRRMALPIESWPTGWGDMMIGSKLYDFEHLRLDLKTSIPGVSNVDVCILFFQCFAAKFKTLQDVTCAAASGVHYSYSNPQTTSSRKRWPGGYYLGNLLLETKKDSSRAIEDLIEAVEERYVSQTSFWWGDIMGTRDDMVWHCIASHHQGKNDVFPFGAENTQSPGCSSPCPKPVPRSQDTQTRYGIFNLKTGSGSSESSSDEDLPSPGDTADLASEADRSLSSDEDEDEDKFCGVLDEQASYLPTCYTVFSQRRFTYLTAWFNSLLICRSELNRAPFTRYSTICATWDNAQENGRDWTQDYEMFRRDYAYLDHVHWLAGRLEDLTSWLAQDSTFCLATFDTTAAESTFDLFLTDSRLTYFKMVFSFLGLQAGFRQLDKLVKVLRFGLCTSRRPDHAIEAYVLDFCHISATTGRTRKRPRSPEPEEPDNYCNKRVNEACAI